MNADGIPSLWAQTVCVYSVRGFLESNASACAVSKTNHALAQKLRIKRPVGKDLMPTRQSDTTKRAGKQTYQNFARGSQLEGHLCRLYPSKLSQFRGPLQFRPLSGREAQEIVLSCARAACFLRSGV